MTKTKTFIRPAVCATASVIIAMCLVRACVYFSGDIAGLFDGTAGRVLSQWKTARVNLPVYMLLATGAIAFLWSILCRKAKEKARRKKLISAGLAVAGILIFLAVFLCTLLLTRVNGIPLHTVLAVVKNIL